MKFLLQEDILLDFIFALQKAKEWWDWWKPEEKIIEFVDSGCSKEICPIGSIEFCLDYYKQLGIVLKPMNIPENLWTYGIGYVSEYGSGKNIRIEDFINRLKNKNRLSNDRIKHLVYEHSPGWFIKSESKFKYPGNGFYGSLGDFINSDYYDSSDLYQIGRGVVGLQDEWRIFVFEKKILDMKRYSFEESPLSVHSPDLEIINTVIEKIDLPSYSFDLGIVDQNYRIPNHEPKYTTKIVEVHDFFSCGLYGFDDYKILPYMLYRSHLHKFL